jgi:hypothetical protein
MHAKRGHRKAGGGSFATWPPGVHLDDAAATERFLQNGLPTRSHLSE